jgi:hypothetical protein
MKLTYPREWLVICNRALALIGADPVQSLQDSGIASQNLNILLPDAVQEVLAYHPYRCARKRSSLASLVDSPVFGFSYAYQLPSDFCSLVRVYSDNVLLSMNDYQMEGSTILSDVETMDIVYTALPETPKSLTPWVQTCIVYLLAYKMAELTTSNDNLIMRLYQEYQAHLLESVKKDNQGSGDTQGEPWWTEGR